MDEKIRGVLSPDSEALDVPTSFAVDLVIGFSISPSPDVSSRSSEKRDAEASSAQSEYTALLSRLQGKGLRATSRAAKVKKGRPDGLVWVFVGASEELLNGLAEQEKSEDFLHAVTTAPAVQQSKISPSDRLRLVHELVSGSVEQGGLAIVPGSSTWAHVTTVFALHDKEVNDLWTKAWLGQDWTVGLNIKDNETDLILRNFGPSIALYFSFLSFYTVFSAPLAIIGVLAWLFLPPYSPVYAAVVSLWALFFVESFRIRERVLAQRFQTVNVETGRPRLRTESTAMSQNRSWWKTDLRMLASVPALLLCALLLVAVLTTLFIFEAFATALYQGWGKEHISLVPTIAFSIIVPQILAVYRKIAVRLSSWEDHKTNRHFENALTSKTFALNSIVAFAGLFLSAYVYIPFGQVVMEIVDQHLFATPAQQTTLEKVSEAVGGPAAITTSPSGRGVINEQRLQDQIFAYTVTNQIINAFTELGLPIIMRWWADYRAKGKTDSTEKDAIATSEKPSAARSSAEVAFLAKVEREADLPEYALFGDYAEMVTQFGYVALWSACWPLASLPILVNNYFELRSDALKVCLNVRKPLPARVSTIGPWLKSLTVLSWFSVVVNATLYSLFHPRPCDTNPKRRGFAFLSTSHDHEHDHTSPSVAGTFFPLLLVALAASHAWFVARLAIRYVLGRVVWEGSVEKKVADQREETVRGEYLQSHLKELKDKVEGGRSAPGDEREEAFWSSGALTADDIKGMFKNE